MKKRESKKEGSGRKKSRCFAPDASVGPFEGDQLVISHKPQPTLADGYTATEPGNHWPAKAVEHPGRREVPARSKTKDIFNWLDLHSYFKRRNKSDETLKSSVIIDHVTTRRFESIQRATCLSASTASIPL